MIISILMIFFIISLISKIIGDFFINTFHFNTAFPKVLFGFLAWIACLFVLSKFLKIENISSYNMYSKFILTTVLLILISIKYINFKLYIVDIVYIFVFITIMVYLSIRYTLGEQLGDNVYLFTLVTKNIDTLLLNNFNYGTGLVSDSVIISTSKENLTFYHFYSFILYYFYKIKEIFNSDYVPAYLLNMWVNNLLFYFFSSTLILSIIKILKTKLWTSILIFLFAGLFIGTYYYNLTLPHFGVTFLGLGISLSLLIIWEYLETREFNYIVVLFLILFAINSMASTGMLMSAYLVFGFISVLIFIKDQNALLYAGMLLVPIIIYANQVKELILVPYLVPVIAFLAILLVLLNYIKIVKELIYKYFYIVLGLLWFALIFVSIKTIPDYTTQILHFSDPKENFDRVRDYFTFSNSYQTVLNLFHYLLLINIVLNKKTRNFGFIFVIIIAFFINPFSYPILYKYTQWLYHRSYFVLFNITSISFGIYALVNNLKAFEFKFRLPIKLSITVLIIFFTFTNITTYENNIYIPGEDFNPLYKMNNTQIDVLLELRKQVIENELENPNVISQIYGTLMIVPEVHHFSFTVSDRRAWNPENEEKLPQLYRMMYTPVFSGDDGPRYNVDYSKLCSVLEKQKILPSYMVLDKTLTTYDEKSGNWLPMYWFARGCADIVYENDVYVLYEYVGTKLDHIVN